MKITPRVALELASHEGLVRQTYKQAIIFAARSLKDMPEILSDYTDDKYWPE